MKIYTLPSTILLAGGWKKNPSKSPLEFMEFMDASTQDMCLLSLDAMHPQKVFLYHSFGVCLFFQFPSSQ
jgi:hypothetical protein